MGLVAAQPSSRSTANLLGRLRGVRGQRRGWLAQCPAHGDRSPSLSISEGRDGRTLLHCFAGCAPATIVAVLGLELTDLFVAAPGVERVRRAQERPTLEVISRTVDRELDEMRQRLIAELGYAPPLRAAHHNEVRRQVAMRFGVTLQDVPNFWWEYNPHDMDPAWPFLLERAVFDIAPTVSPAMADRVLIDRAAALARSWLREIASW